MVSAVYDHLTFGDQCFCLYVNEGFFNEGKYPLHSRSCDIYRDPNYAGSVSSKETT